MAVGWFEELKQRRVFIEAERQLLSDDWQGLRARLAESGLAWPPVLPAGSPQRPAGGGP